MDIGEIYGKYLPLTPGQTPAARSEQFKFYKTWEDMISSYASAYTGPSLFGQAPAASSNQIDSVYNKMEDPILSRRTGYAQSNRPRLTDSEIDELARKYDFQHMTQDAYDAFLDDLVDKGLLTRAEAGYFGYGGEIRLDPMDSKVMVMSVAGWERKYSQHTPFLGEGVYGDGDMTAWLAEMMKSTEYSAFPEAFGRVRQLCEMYGAVYDAVARATNSSAYTAGVSEEEPDIISQILDPNSSFYQDMYNRMRVRMEESEEEKKKQAIIDALDAILETLSAKKDDRWRKPDAVSSMTGLAQTIDSLDKDDPRKEELNLLRERLQNLGIYLDLDVGVKGKDQNTWGTTLTQQLIREEAKDTQPSIFDII